MTNKEGVLLWALPVDEIFSRLNTSKTGLSSKEAQIRLKDNGKNALSGTHNTNFLELFLSQYKDPLLLVLIFAAAVSFFLGENTNAFVIISIIFIDSIIGFYQEYKAQKMVDELEKYVKIKARVYRDGKLVEVDAENLVVGDIVQLNIGDIIPADIRLFQVDELSTDEAALTGESIAVMKKITVVSEKRSLPQYLHNMAFTATNVASGTGTGIVTAVGKNTFFGKTASMINRKDIETDFQKGIKNFGKLAMKIVVIMTLFVFIANTILGKSPFDSFLFALALAVGITPEVLPIIITITLSHGALKMAKEKVIVKKLSAIEDLGNIDTLCADKTGTLTIGAISLQSYVDFNKVKNDAVLLQSLICNSAKEDDVNEFSSNSIDHAIWIHSKNSTIMHELKKYEVTSENPFDFNRRIMSCLAINGSHRMIIAKGSPDKILSKCNSIISNGKKVKFDKKRNKEIQKMINDYELKGYRVIAIANKVTTKRAITISDEKELSFLGLLTFFDPPKDGAKETVKTMQELGIQIKIMTGDSPVITRRLCQEVGLTILHDKVITGDELEKMNIERIKETAIKYNVFARVSPEQKYLIVSKLTEAGHEVGFLGDGINDAPALRAASVGITVDHAAGIAKEAADIILLKPGLNVVVDGVKQGRRTFGNITKYIMNTISANFGNMMTVALSSLLLPFIPMLPSQILLNNFASDLPLLAIPTDNVDREMLKKPKKWNIKFIEHFMLFFGIISTVFDLILILFLIFFFHAEPAVFRTAWFIESTLSEILVTFAIRTRLPFFKSKPSKWLLWTSFIASMAIITITYTVLGGKFFEFTQLPIQILALIGIVLLTYFMTAEFAKRWFFNKYQI